MKRLTTDQMKTLSVFDTYFETAINRNWASYPGRDAITTMNDILSDITGIKRKPNYSCSICVLNLLKDIGTIYRNQLEGDKVVKVTIKEKKTSETEPVKTTARKASTRKIRKTE